MNPRKTKKETGPGSVFVARVKYLDGKIKYPVLLRCETLGHFSTLKRAVALIKSRMHHTILAGDYAFKLFEVDEFVLNLFSDEEKQIRNYDRNGKFVGSYRFDIFKGKNGSDCKFHLGEVVEFVVDSQKETRLKLGIVVELPPDKRQYKELRQQYSKGRFTFYLDSSENRYLIYTNSGITRWNDKENRYYFFKRTGITGGQEMCMFNPSVKISETAKKVLQKGYERYRNKKISRQKAKKRST